MCALRPMSLATAWHDHTCANGAVHHLRRRRRHGQVDPGAPARGSACRGAASTASLTREPGGSPFAEQVRALHPRRRSLPARTAIAEALLFYAARADHLAQTIRAGAGRGAMGDLRPLLGFDARLPGRWPAAAVPKRRRARADRRSRRPRPDLTLMLDLPAEVGLARAPARRRGAASGRRRLTRGRDLAFHRELREGSSRSPGPSPSAASLIDAERTPDAGGGAGLGSRRAALLPRGPR